jgi:succinyl-CoA synthetase beta subunit
VGTNADEAARILAASGDPDLQTAATLDEAVEKAVAAATATTVAAAAGTRAAAPA